MDIEIPDADRLWDDWAAARSEQPDLTLEEFAERYQGAAVEVTELLGPPDELEETAGPPPLVELSTGTSFAGFRLLRVLGEGASGIVFEAEGREHGHVALKVLNPLTTVGGERRRAIMREARIAASLDHEGIVRILESGVERGYAWIAAELVEGEPLSVRGDLELTNSKRERRAIDVGLQVAGALAHAHGRGVVHRDLKPANLLQTPGGDIKLVDFGLARDDGAAFAISHSGEPIGTPLYMAPEQLRGERDVGPAADLYALGLIILEIARGDRLTTRGDGMATLAHIAAGRMHLGRRMLKGLPRPLAAVMSRCLEPDPRDRYSAATSLLTDLEAVRDGRPPPLGRLGPARRLGRSARRRPSRYAVGTLIAVLLAWWIMDIWSGWTTFTIDAIEQGVLVTVDGRDVGLTSCTLALSPGKHEYTLGSFSGTLRVPWVGRGWLTKACQPFYPGDPTTAKLEIPGIHYEEGQWAWIQVATDRREIELEVRVEGAEPLLKTVSGVCAVRVPTGEHCELTVSAQGCRTVHYELDVPEQELVVLSFQLDDEDDDWQSLVVYSPLDRKIRDLELVNARLYVERTTQDAFTQQPARKVYWGPVDAGQTSEVRFGIELPFEIERIRPQVFSNPGIPRESAAWYLLEMGPSWDSMVTVWGDRPPATERQLEGDMETRVLKFNQRMRDSGAEGVPYLCVRYRFGGCLPSIDGVQGGALRTNSLPRSDDWGRLIWDPALQFHLLPRGSQTSRKSVPPHEAPASTVVGPEALTGEMPPELWAAHIPGKEHEVPWFAVADPDHDGGTGRVSVVSEDGTELWTRTGESPGDLYGSSVAVLGDLDGDGVSDLAIGAPQHSDQKDSKGYVEVVSTGKQRVLHRIDGRVRGELFGTTVVSAGDTNGDGIDDVLVASMEYRHGGWGFARVFSGRDGSLILAMDGHNQADHFGRAAAPVGDVDGDGHEDVIIGAPDDDPFGIDSGTATIISGRTGEVLRVFEGQRHNTKVGMGIATGGVDENGRLDIFLGGQEVRHYRGSGLEFELVRVFRDSNTPYLRTPLAGVDWNDDGVSDLAITYGKAGTGAGGPQTTIFDGAQGDPLVTFWFQVHAFQEVDEDRVLVGGVRDGDGVLPVFLPRR